MLKRGFHGCSLVTVLFVDGAFAAEGERLLRICHAMQGRGWNKHLQWACCLRADQARPALLREAGIRIFANTMFGLPGATATDMDNRLSFIRAA